MEMIPVGNQPPAPPQPPAVSSPEPSRQLLSEVVKGASLPKVVQNGIRFSKDAESGKIIITIVDPDSGEVIRQVPPEEIVALSKMLESLQGNLSDLIA